MGSKVCLSRLFSLCLVCVAAAPISPADASDRTDFYLEMQQREECEELGGTLDGNRCYIPDQGGAGAVAQVYVQNQTGCDPWLLVAYRPPDADAHRVVGWWRVEPTYWSGFGLYDDDAPMMHDGRFPLYYYVETDDGRALTDGDSAFNYEGAEFMMVESEHGLLDGYFWVTVDGC